MARAEDCVAYNPNNLTTNYTAGIWSVKDGAKEVMRLHGAQSDNTGQKGLALAKRFKAHCFIGRNNNPRGEALLHLRLLA